LLLSGSNPVSRYVVQIILVFAICISVIGFIFLPKMLRPLLDNESEHRPRLGVSYVSSTSNAVSRLNSQESNMSSNPDAGDASGAKAARLNSQDSSVTWKDDVKA